MATVKYLDENGLSTVWSKVKGIVTPKADKVSGATNGHLAGLNSSGNLTDSGLAASNIAQKDGSYSGMTVGAAEDLVSAESVASEFTSRITGGSTAVGKGGTALVDKIKGRTLVWNQLVRDGNFPTTTNWTPTNCTITVSDGALHISPNNSSSAPYVTNGAVPINNTHKYYISVTGKATQGENLTIRVNGTSISAPINVTLTNTYVKYSAISLLNSNSSGTAIFYILSLSGYSAGNIIDVKDVMLIDLTLMFGAGNEPSTSAEFEALYSGPYYETNPGTLINNGKQTEYDLVWNQMCQGVSGVTLSYNSTTNTYYASGTRTYGEAGSETSAFVAGHIYCGKLVVKKDTGSKLKYVIAQAGGGASNGLTFSGMNGTGTYTAYGTSTNAGNLRVLATFGSSSVTFDVEFSLNVFDLTVMFGAGNEPASPEEFEAMFPNDYYAYDAGTEQHFSFPQFKTKIETVGFNQWDEEWLVGRLAPSTGAYDSSYTNSICSKNYCPAFPGSTYYVKCGDYTNMYYLAIYFYDINKNFIDYWYCCGTTIVAPSNAAYMKIGTNVTTYIYGSTYLNDICISLSDPSRNGTYEPYWRSELELGLGDIKVKSHNLWDEEWELGAYNDYTGAPVITTTNLRSKENNPISVFPNTVYCFTGGAFRVLFYDSEMNFISKVNVASGNTVTTPANCGYIRFYMSSGYGVTYLNDICINVSDPAYNGRYEPYGDDGVITITGGLKSAGTVYDEISGNKLVKRIESVDLGTLTWSAISDASYPNRFQTVISGIAVTGNNLIPRYINKGIGGYGDGINEDKSFDQASTTINVHDSSYSDAATFKAAVAGVPLYYALAQPIEYELADALPTAMRNDPYGTERRLPEDTAAIVTAPFRADITYSTNIKEAVQSLPQNYINVNSMQDFLAALGEQMGGTWTMRPADGKFDFTFTPNPVEPTL